MSSSPQRLGIRTRAVYTYIRDYWAEHDRAPSCRELMAGCALSSTSIPMYHIMLLERHGLLRRSGVRWRPRAIVPLDAIGHPAIGRPDYEQVAVIGEHGDGTPIHVWRMIVK